MVLPIQHESSSLCFCTSGSRQLFTFFFISPHPQTVSSVLRWGQKRQKGYHSSCIACWFGGHWGTFSGVVVSSGNKIGVIFFLWPFRDHDIWFPCLGAADFFFWYFFSLILLFMRGGENPWTDLLCLLFSVRLEHFAMMLTGDFSTDKKTTSVGIFATALPFPPFLPVLILWSLI